MDHQLSHRALAPHGELVTCPQGFVSFPPRHSSSSLAQLTAESGRAIFCAFHVLQLFLKVRREGWRSQVKESALKLSR